MPVVIPAVIAGAIAATSVTITAGTLALAFSWTTFALVTGGSLILGQLSKALAPKAGKSNFASQAAQQTLSFREAVTSRKIVYGSTRIGGPVVFLSSTGSNEYLHLIVALSGHEIDSIDEVWIDDYSVPIDALDADGNVTAGRYKDYLRLRFHTGTAAQAADPFLVSEVSEWDASGQLKGVAYLYARLRYSQDLYPGGIPNISCIVRGKKLFDPRSGNTEFSCNSALAWRDFMTNQVYGPAAQEDDINEDNVFAQANICDEFVDVDPVSITITSANAASDIITTEGDFIQFQLGDKVQFQAGSIAVGGLTNNAYYYVIPYQYKGTPRLKLAATYATALKGIRSGLEVGITSTGNGKLIKVAEPRYSLSGVLDTAAVIKDNITAILSSCAGRAIYAGGQWRLLVAGYQTPTLTLYESDFVGPMSLQTRLSRRDRFNYIKGTYINPANNYQATDYPAQTVQEFVDLDGGLVIPKDNDMPLTQRSSAAQRINKVELLRSRQELSFRVNVSLKGFNCQTGDVVALNVPRLGWDDKPFEVIDFKLTSDGGSNPRLYVEMGFRETAPEVYDWLSTDAIFSDPAPNTNFPNALVVSVPLGVAFSSTATATSGGDKVYSLSLMWLLHPDAFVLQGGQYEIQYKKSADPMWLPSFFVDGSITASTVLNSSVNVNYDLRIRALNSLGVRSAWVTILNAVAGSSGGAGSTLDWGDYHSSAGSSLDWGDFHSSPTANNDWGFFT